MLMTIPRIPARNPIKERLRRLRILAIAANLRGRIRFKKNRDKKLICERKVSSRALIAPISVHDLFPNDLLLPREPVRSSTSLRELLVATPPHLIKSLSSNDPFHEELYEKKPRISRSVTSRDWTPKPAFDAKDKSNSIATAKQDNNIKTLWKLDALAHMFANKNQLANLNNGPAWKSLGKCCTRGCDVSQDEKPINGQMNDVSPVTPITTLISNVKSEVVTSVACLSPIRPVYSPPTVSDESSVFEEHIPVTLLPRDSMEFVTPNRRLRYQYADSFTDDVQGKILAPLCEFDGCETIGGTTCDSEIKVVVKTPRSETSLNNNTSYDSNVVSDAFSSFSRIQDDEPLIEDTVSDRRESSPNWFRHAIEMRRERMVEETQIEENDSCESLTTLMASLKKTPKATAGPVVLNLEVLQNSPLLTRACQRSSIFKPPRLSGRDSLEWAIASDPVHSPSASTSNISEVEKLTRQIGNLSLQRKRRDSNC